MLAAQLGVIRTSQLDTELESKKGLSAKKEFRVEGKPDASEKSPKIKKTGFLPFDDALKASYTEGIIKRALCHT